MARAETRKEDFTLTAKETVEARAKKAKKKKKASEFEAMATKIADEEYAPFYKQLAEEEAALPKLGAFGSYVTTDRVDPGRPGEQLQALERIRRERAGLNEEKETRRQRIIDDLSKEKPKGLMTGDLRSIETDVNIPMAGLFSGVRAEQEAASRAAGRELEQVRRAIDLETEEAAIARMRMGQVDREAAEEQAEQELLMEARNKQTEEALKLARAAQDAAVKQHMDEIDTINQDIRDFKVDQGRAFPDTTSKVAMVIATAMGALAEGLSQGRLPNTALKLMNDAIDRDIRLQLSELDNMKDAVKNKHNVVARLMSIHGDRNRATLQAGILARKAMEDRITSIKTSAKSKKAVDAADLAIAELNAANEQAKRADIQLNYQMKMDGVKIGMQEAQFGIRAAAKASKADSENQEKMNRIVNTVNALETLGAQKPEGIGAQALGYLNQLLDLDVKAKTYESLTTQLTTQLINLSQDRISDGDMAIFKRISGGNLYTIIPGQQEARLKSVKAFVNTIAARPAIKNDKLREDAYGGKQSLESTIRTFQDSVK